MQSCEYKSIIQFNNRMQLHIVINVLNQAVLSKQYALVVFSMTHLFYYFIIILRAIYNFEFLRET